ncbi:MAG TPA: hypothetical protein DDZ34_04740 [Syntrophaceae bacterium]|nr:hypothetical protein [Syntrophaceae bacterium]
MKLLSIFMVGVVSILISVSTAFGAGLCSPELVIGQISLISPEGEKGVVIRRNGEIIEAVTGDCLVFGDSVDAGKNALVGIVTGTKYIEIGRSRPGTTWNAPQMPQERPAAGFVQSLKQVWETICRNYDLPRPAVSRGGAQCDGEGYGVALEPLISLPPVQQRIGSDLTQLVVAWKKGTGRRQVRAQLVLDGGKTLAATQVCHRSWGILEFPSGTLRPGQALMLELSDTGGTRITWRIEVVPAAALPSPQEPVREQSMLGVWRMLLGGAGTRLDALSRMTSLDSPLATPRWVFNAVLEDKLSDEVRQ